MNAHGRETPRDLDDWFDEPDPEPPRRPSRASVDSDAQTHERAATRNRRILVAVGFALAFVLVGLALGGVFSSGGTTKANKPLTTQTSPTTTQSTTPAAPLLPAATVKLGDHGNKVKQLQRALRSLGYTVGTIDGIFGASTQSALIAFQTAHHLAPDGVLGPATRTALLNALRPG